MDLPLLCLIQKCRLDEIPAQKDDIWLHILCSGNGYLYLLFGPDSRTAASFTNSNNYQLKGDQSFLQLKFPRGYVKVLEKRRDEVVVILTSDVMLFMLSNTFLFYPAEYC